MYVNYKETEACHIKFCRTLFCCVFFCCSFLFALILSFCGHICSLVSWFIALYAHINKCLMINNNKKYFRL